MDPEHISTILPSVLKRIREGQNMDDNVYRYDRLIGIKKRRLSQEMLLRRNEMDGHAETKALSQPKIVTCNMCGNEWPYYGRDDNKIKCPICGSNESFSIR
jgi:rubrerythrin